ncbi:ABC transporter ATP-binding protein [uncultured Bosea sp.]|uniref:ABC transporter ATP-binding protein n=1 Tax=uncultured Bosea sp. TaxID=211457 RepID=UPI0025F19E85|nr:ABC transporter ATP-binding protein [uncultured Bosea sp.]
MARLTIDRAQKRFGSYIALDDVSIDVADGEFLAVLGPSGCGKTTLLRQIAGFDKLDGGVIRIGERLVSSRDRHVPPEHRKLGIVFQSYALWPHMTVAENVAYGLIVAGIRDPERARRVAAALDLVGLNGFAERRPGMLSGGQRQRVALARCLVTEPSLVLLDEPLANLDVHLRASMEDEFARFHERTGTTMVYITHDQAEAMALADRIAVMDRGRLLQLATPSVLYREPANTTVAGFIGEGMVLPAAILSPPQAGRCKVRVLGVEAVVRCRPDQPVTNEARLCLRARDIGIAHAGEPGLQAAVERLSYQGGHYRLEARSNAASGALLHLDATEPAPAQPGDAIRIAIQDGWVIPESVSLDKAA